MRKFSYIRLFKSLAHPGRLKIWRLLASGGELNVSQIIRGTGLEQTAVSHHLKDLLYCGLVFVNRKGRARYYSANPYTSRVILNFLGNFA